jgi:hypothetical protein
VVQSPLSRPGDHPQGVIARARGAAVRGLALAVILALSGCAFAELRHPATGERVRCGTVPIPLWYSYERALDRAMDEVACIEEAQRDSYR